MDESRRRTASRSMEASRRMSVVISTAWSYEHCNACESIPPPAPDVALVSLVVVVVAEVVAAVVFVVVVVLALVDVALEPKEGNRDDGSESDADADESNDVGLTSGSNYPDFIGMSYV